MVLLVFCTPKEKKKNKEQNQTNKNKSNPEQTLRTISGRREACNKSGYWWVRSHSLNKMVAVDSTQDTPIPAMASWSPGMPGCHQKAALRKCVNCGAMSGSPGQPRSHLCPDYESPRCCLIFLFCEREADEHWSSAAVCDNTSVCSYAHCCVRKEENLIT